MSPDPALPPQTQAPVSFWKKCSTCKKPISFKAVYYLCSVSTCRNKHLGIVFCTYLCWDAHLAFARHRSASAEEERAPAG